MSRFKQDHILIEEIRTGEPRHFNAAIHQLYEQNRARVAKIVRIGGGTEEDVQMILNDAVLVLLRKVQTGDFDPGRAKLSTLLFTIAKFKWLDELKRRYSTNESQVKLNEGVARPQPNLENPIESGIFSQEERQKIRHALQQLDPGCRKLFELKYLQGISLRVLAENFGISEDAMKQRHRRCKQRLKRIFGSDPRVS